MAIVPHHRRSLCLLIKTVLNSPRILWRVLCSVVEDRNVTIRQSTRIVLIAEIRWCEFRMVTDECELIALSTQLPHHVTCRPIDLYHLRHVAHGDDPVAVVINPQRVVVTVSNRRRSEILVGIRDWQMIKRLPLNNNPTVAIDFLDDGIDDVRSWMSARYDLAHINRYIFRTKHHQVAVWQHMNVMLRSQIPPLLRHEFLDSQKRVYDVHSCRNRSTCKHHELRESQPSVGEDLVFKWIVRHTTSAYNSTVHVVHAKEGAEWTWRYATVRCKQQEARFGTVVYQHLQRGKVWLCRCNSTCNQEYEGYAHRCRITEFLDYGRDVLLVVIHH